MAGWQPHPETARVGVSTQQHQVSRQVLYLLRALKKGEKAPFFQTNARAGRRVLKYAVGADLLGSYDPDSKVIDAGKPRLRFPLENLV